MDKLSKQIEQKIMLGIIRGVFPVGASLPKEDDLVEQYGVSRVIIREAKRSLQVLGMVKSIKRAGSYVMPKSQWNFFNGDLFSRYLEESDDAVRQLENYYALRLLLEPELVDALVRQTPSGFIAHMEELFALMVKAHAVDDTTVLFRTDLEFHLRLYEASDNVLLMPLAQLMRPLFLEGFQYSHSEWERGLDEHNYLLQAIRNGDSEAARAQSRVLIENARARFRQQLGTGIQMQCFIPKDTIIQPDE